MYKKILTVAALAAITLFSACSGGSSHGNATDGYILKFSLDKGEKYSYNMDMDMNMKQNVQGQDMNIVNNMTVGYTFEVTGDSSGWKKVESTISRIAMHMDMGIMKIDFDSDKPDSSSASAGDPSAMVGKMFGALKGGHFMFTISDKGQIGSVSGMREMVESMLNKVDVPNAEMMKGSVENSFNEESFKQNIQQSFSIYPDKPVKPGESWTKTLTLNNNGIDMKLDNTYTLQDVKGDDASVKVVSKITSAGDSTNAMGVAMDMSGDMTGDMVFDIQTGLPKSGTTDMNLKMQVNSNGMQMPMDMQMKMTYTGKKL